MRISDWSSDVCSSDLSNGRNPQLPVLLRGRQESFFELPAPQWPSVQCDAPHINQLVGPDSRHVSRPAALTSRERLPPRVRQLRSEEHTSALQSLMRISYAVFCMKKHIKHI